MCLRRVVKGTLEVTKSLHQTIQKKIENPETRTRSRKYGFQHFQYNRMKYAMLSLAVKTLKITG